MKKLLFIGLLLSGCQCSSTKNAFVVYKYTSFRANLCTYQITRTNIPFDDLFYIVDSCGKFQVGDTLTLQK